MLPPGRSRPCGGPHGRPSALCALFCHSERSEESRWGEVLRAPAFPPARLGGVYPTLPPRGAADLVGGLMVAPARCALSSVILSEAKNLGGGKAWGAQPPLPCPCAPRLHPSSGVFFPPARPVALYPPCGVSPPSRSPKASRLWRARSALCHVRAWPLRPMPVLRRGAFITCRGVQLNAPTPRHLSPFALSLSKGECILPTRPLAEGESPLDTPERCGRRADVAAHSGAKCAPWGDGCDV